MWECGSKWAGRLRLVSQMHLDRFKVNGCQGCLSGCRHDSRFSVSYDPESCGIWGYTSQTILESTMDVWQGARSTTLTKGLYTAQRLVAPTCLFCQTPNDLYYFELGQPGGGGRYTWKSYWWNPKDRQSPQSYNHAVYSCPDSSIPPSLIFQLLTHPHDTADNGDRPQWGRANASRPAKF